MGKITVPFKAGNSFAPSNQDEGDSFSLSSWDAVVTIANMESSPDEEVRKGLRDFLEAYSIGFSPQHEALTGNCVCEDSGRRNVHIYSPRLGTVGNIYLLEAREDAPRKLSESFHFKKADDSYVYIASKDTDYIVRVRFD